VSFFPFSSMGIVGFLFPLFFFFIVFRVIKGIVRASRRDIESRLQNTRLPELDEAYGTINRYPAPPKVPDQGEIFRLADKMHGRITLSDIVIATNLNMKDAEEVIESMVDGLHVTMEVGDNGRVTYEFPEIIARFEDNSSSQD
jgi:hypothetical protein